MCVIENRKMLSKILGKNSISFFCDSQVAFLLTDKKITPCENVRNIGCRLITVEFRNAFQFNLTWTIHVYASRDTEFSRL